MFQIFRFPSGTSELEIATFYVDEHEESSLYVNVWGESSQE
jgi:hypothetical protein